VIDALKVCWHTLRHLNQHGYLYIWANVLWFLLTLPILTAPAAFAGLCALSRQAHLAPGVSLDDFWRGFRMNLRRGLVMGLVNVVVVVINLSNLSSYRNVSDPSANILRGTWIISLVVWFIIQFYMWPLMYELKQPGLWGAMRNAAVMLLMNPLYSVILIVAGMLVAGVSTFLFLMWVLLTGSVLAALATRAVLERLAAAGLRPALPQPEDEAAGDVGGFELE